MQTVQPGISELQPDSTVHNSDCTALWWEAELEWLLKPAEVPGCKTRKNLQLFSPDTLAYAEGEICGFPAVSRAAAGQHSLLGSVPVSKELVFLFDQ